MQPPGSQPGGFSFHAARRASLAEEREPRRASTQGQPGPAVCVSELAANIVEHGGVAPGAGEIAIKLRHVKLELEIEISDPGRAFDPFDPARIEPVPQEIGPWR